MPRTKLGDKYSKPKPPPDLIKALILERLKALGADPDKLCAAMGISKSTYYARLRMHTSDWPLGDLLRLCQYLGVELDALRAAIRYPKR